MKLCPQCEFIYEDSQALCDMDGQELVFEPTLAVSSERDRVPQVRRSGLRGMPLCILAGLVLVAGLLLMYRVFTPGTEIVEVNALSARDGASTKATLPAEVVIPEKKVSPTATLNLSPDLTTGAAVSETAKKAAQTVPVNSAEPGRSDSKSPNNHATAAKAPARLSVYSLPRVKPLPALKPIPKLAERELSRIPPSQKPAVENKKKESKVSSFLKKTARVLTKPFKR